MKVSDYKEQIMQMMGNLPKVAEDIPSEVFQTGVDENREIIGGILDMMMLPGSRIVNSDNLKQLMKYSQAGKSCLLLFEHYSNFDYPNFFRLIQQDKNLGEDVARVMLPIQGMKLSHGNEITSAFSRSYDTIIIYPSRYLDNITDPEELAEARKISTPINHAAVKELTHQKHHGRIICVFAAGTRYRPWDPSSKEGVREIYSYLKTFDYVSFVAINGNTLRPTEGEVMEHDIPEKDLMYFTVTEPVSGRKLRKEWDADTPEGEDSKKYVVSRVMQKLDEVHEAAEPARLAEKKKI